ncbi:MAG TPA: type II toxin-antitoxin system VapC family toxin [Candidatus Thermoplasmatota archaeon]|nr:type II toxin-antitoxin system VapC family toxin [Candidatus Thermoplasmatota archaeon]
MSDAVIDASALLLGLEPEGDLARRALVALADERRLAAPALLAWEVGHVIHRKRPGRYGATHEERQEAFEAATSAVALVAPTPEALAAAARLCAAHPVGFYDAAYLEMAARGEGSVLVSADADLLRVARRVLGEGRALTVEAAAALGEAG